MGTKRALLVAGVVLAALALAVAGCGGDDDEAGGDTTATETTTTETNGETGGALTATVGPGFTIELSQDGAAVETLPAGSYTVEVDDQSDIHNFHLTGPGVDETTEVADVGQQTWEVTFEAGTYNYVCDPHASTMTGSFEVTG